MSVFSLRVGDCREVMASMDADSVDAVVTDPPYEIGFMSKRWDRRGVSFESETWAACHRVLKPGGRLLAFGGTRTHHRIWCAIEDAGFVIEDTIMWLYGTGFPKHSSKLKPAFEPVVVARKSRVSALNVDGCRIGTADTRMLTSLSSIGGPDQRTGGGVIRQVLGGSSSGRWPANVVLGCACEHEHEPDCAVEMLDEQSGERAAGNHPANRRGIGFTENAGGSNSGTSGSRRSMESGGASRFLYTAKASRTERNLGLEGAPRRFMATLGDGIGAREHNPNQPSAWVQNHHPTVKPIELMRWLVRLVTQPGDLVLDPFTGSGTTGIACILEGREFVGVEQNADYADIAKRRITAAVERPSIFVVERPSGGTEPEQPSLFDSPTT